MSSDNTQAPRSKELLVVPLTIRPRPAGRAALRAAWETTARWAEQQLVPWLLDDLAPWLSRRGREAKTACTQGWSATAPWLKLLTVLAVLTAATPALSLITDLLRQAVTAAQHAAAHPHHTGLAATVLDPVSNWLTAHSSGLPVSATTVGGLWEGAGAVLLVVSARGSVIGRMLWCGFGAGTAAMVWSAAPDPGRPLATAITATAWAAASLIALKGIHLRPVLIVDSRPTVHVIDRTGTRTADQALEQSADQDGHVR
jgi:hypothetical protein